jgi:hypothetical protein
MVVLMRKTCIKTHNLRQIDVLCLREKTERTYLFINVLNISSALAFNWHVTFSFLFLVFIFELVDQVCMFIALSLWLPLLSVFFSSTKSQKIVRFCTQSLSRIHRDSYSTKSQKIVRFSSTKSQRTEHPGILQATNS